MKKWLAIVFISCSLFLLCSYIFIPSTLNISNVKNINCTVYSANRFLMNQGQWSKWWPDKSSTERDTSTTTVNYKGQRYHITAYMYNAVKVQIENNKGAVTSTLLTIPVGKDSVHAEWSAAIPSSTNPLTRVRRYLEKRKMEEDMDTIMSSLKAFLENKENVYGFQVAEIKVKDTLLVAKKYVSKTYPGKAEIYQLIDNIKSYVAANNAVVTNSPMLNVMQDSSGFQTMVALPVDKQVPENKEFLSRRMVPGQILVAEVKGGEHTVKEAIMQLHNYINDHHYTSPAIPFESLVTDRMQEKDTSKWVTKIYYPVF